MACAMLCLAVGGGVFFAAEEKLVTDKTTYTADEPIYVTAIGSGKDWVGIYFPGEEHSIRWTYIDSSNDGVGSGVQFDIRKAKNLNNGAPSVLSPGKYIIRLMPNDTEDLSMALAEIEITITSDDNVPQSGGDMTKLTVNKTTFGYNEAITVSAIGSGLDWVGIYYPGEPHSLYWTYLDPANGGVGSGVQFNMKTVANKSNSAPSKLPPGTYVIRLMPNDSTEISEALAWVTITIEPQESAGKLDKPLSATYVLANETDGFSEGTLTVKLGEDNTAEDIVCYWADDNGKLEGYTSLAKFKVTGETTVRKLGANVYIPAGATKLLVYGALGGKLSDECVEIKLPEGAASKDPGAPIVEFQVMSDIHITTNNGHTHNRNFLKMLKDVAENSKKSIGIFIAGDIADSGNAKEYENLKALYASVSGVPKYYLAIGNHDLYNGSLEDKTNLFLQNAQLPTGERPESSHYDFWLEGYHFVFIGNDQLVGGLKTTLSPKTLNWLDDTLAKDRDAGRPTFVFLHQSLYDTVAGSFPGQGWDGVVTEGKLRNILKKYPEIIMFNGHSHWTLDSEGCMYIRSDKLPTIFNTASVAYLWTSYNVVGGENLNGSQGYYIRVYNDKVMVLGRDFSTGEWVSSAQFYVPFENGTGPLEDGSNSGNGNGTNDGNDQSGSNDTSSTPDSDSGVDTGDKSTGLTVGAVIGICAGAAVVVGGAIAALLITKKFAANKKEK